MLRETHSEPRACARGDYFEFTADGVHQAPSEWQAETSAEVPSR
jgi:hypothetical protein